MRKSRTLAAGTTISLIILSGCSVHRAQEAADAQKQLVGVSKEQRSYASGNGRTDTFGTGVATENSNIASASTTTSSSSRYCTINVVMSADRVSCVNC